jgi:hypothetical protein
LLYDLLISASGAISIAALLFYSYKIARSPVRVVGIVREARESSPSPDGPRTPAIGVSSGALRPHIEGMERMAREGYADLDPAAFIEDVEHPAAIVDLMREGRFSPSSGRLDSWKDIARYLGRDLRTVRRWQEDKGLPVRRVPVTGGQRAVFAYTAELDAWLTRVEFDGTVPHGPELRDAIDASTKKVWRCEKCSLVQFLEKDLRCRRCRSVCDSRVAQAAEAGRAEDAGLAALQREVAEQGKILERLESRIRRVEVESLQRLQGTTQERRETGREELVN